MSYCRFGSDSDVYMYVRAEGIECCGCKLQKFGDGKRFPLLNSTAEAIGHLEDHETAGQLVPQYAYDELKSEATNEN